MSLSMPSPYKHPKTGVYYLRQRVPADLKDKAKGQTVALPIAGALKSFSPGDSVKASLETKDPAEAKARYREADAALSKFWEALRKGPQKLTHKEIQALAGIIYKAWTDTLDDDPGTPEMWQRIEEANSAAMRGKFGLAQFIIGEPEDRVLASLNMRFGEIVDGVLRAQSLIVDEDSRDRLLGAAAKAMSEVATVNKRKAKGDYTPDTEIRNRFPEYAPAAETEVVREIWTAEISGISA